MSERATLRGSRLGGTSFEDESGIEFAPRQRVVVRLPERARVRDPDGRGRRGPLHLGVPAVRRGVASARRQRPGRQGREAGPHPLGHAPGAAVHPGARGHPVRAARAAAQRRHRPGTPAPPQRRPATAKPRPKTPERTCAADSPSLDEAPRSPLGGGAVVMPQVRRRVGASVRDSGPVRRFLSAGFRPSRPSSSSGRARRLNGRRGRSR